MPTDNERKGKPLLDFDRLQLEDVGELWRGIDDASIGRVLRAHLLVEHFVNEHLEKRNPNLGKWREARLDFMQKVKLLDRQAFFVRFIIRGIWTLGEIRNKFAHELSYAIPEEKMKEFFEPDAHGFRSYLNAFTRKHEIGNPTKIDIIEAFSGFASTMLRMGIGVHAQTDEILRDFELKQAYFDGQSKTLDELRDDSPDDDN